MIPNNKFNSIERKDSLVVKKGPSSIIQGELYYYQHIPPSLSHYFPVMHEYSNDSIIEITMDYIVGTPLFFLYRDKQLTSTIVDELFDILDLFHTTPYPIDIKEENVYNNYFKKLEKRFNEDYDFVDASIIYQQVIQSLKETYQPMIVGVIHGDFWFSNILKTDHYKVIDMKGQVDSILTLNGDLYYDYGKLYQSIIGYDLIVQGCTVDKDYIHKMETYFLSKCKKIGLNLPYLKAVRDSLIFGTIPFLDSNKDNVWIFLKSIL